MVTRVNQTLHNEKQKTFVNYTLIRGLIYKIHKDLQELNTLEKAQITSLIQGAMN